MDTQTTSELRLLPDYSEADPPPTVSCWWNPTPKLRILPDYWLAPDCWKDILLCYCNTILERNIVWLLDLLGRIIRFSCWCWNVVKELTSASWRVFLIFMIKSVLLQNILKLEEPLQEEHFQRIHLCAMIAQNNLQLCKSISRSPKGSLSVCLLIMMFSWGTNK